MNKDQSRADILNDPAKVPYLSWLRASSASNGPSLSGNGAYHNRHVAGHAYRPRVNNPQVQLNRLNRQNIQLIVRHERDRAKEDRLTEALRTETETKQRLQLQLTESMKAVQALQSDLESCKQQILKLQPIQAVPDSDISTQYKYFCEEWASWSERQFHHSESVFEAFGVMQGSGAVHQLFLQYLTKEITHIIYSYAAAEIVMVEHFVHRYLHELIVSDQKYHQNLADGFEAFLATIETGMTGLHPKRGKHDLPIPFPQVLLTKNSDTQSIDAWEADVKRVLQKMPEFEGACSTKDSLISKGIGEFFGHLLLLNSAVLWNEVTCRELAAFAKFFKNAIDVSPRTSACEYDFQPGDPIVSRPLHVEDFGNFKLIDAKTNAAIRSANKLRPDSNGCFVVKLCMVHPALRRIDNETGQRVTLVKATVLVELITSVEIMTEPTVI